MREIRIHGVSGTPPQDMLGVASADDVERVMSYIDPRTGFYRTRPGVQPGWWQAPGQAPAAPPEVVSEAYSWGALTSSGGSFFEAVRRAGWLSLLPLALVNVAYWARPDIDRPSAGRLWSAVAVRWAALLLTAALIGSVCLVGIDLVAWQCFRGGGQVCSFAVSLPMFGNVDAGGAVAFLGRDPWHHPARRVLVGTLAPILVLAALWLLSWQSAQRYEAVPDVAAGRSRAEHAAAPTTDAAALDGHQPILRRERMWQGQARVGRQRLLHAAVGLAVTVLFAALTLYTDPNDPNAPWWRVAAQVQREQSWLGLVVIAALLALVAAFTASALSVQDGNDFHGQAKDRPVLDGWARIATGAAAGLAVTAYVCLAALALGPLSDVVIVESREAMAEVPFVGFTFVLLAAIVAGLTFASRGGWWPWLAAAVPLGLAVITNVTLGAGGESEAWPTLAAGALWVVAIVGLMLVLHRTSATPGHAWGGAAPGLILGAATLVGLVFSASLVVGVAAVLNGSQSVTGLQSDFDPERSAGQVAIALGSTASAAEDLLVGGPATLRDAVVCRTADDVSIAGGTLTAATVTAVPEGLPFTGDGVARVVPDVLLDSGQFRLADEALLLEDSVVSQAPDCGAAGAGTFIVAGALPVDGPLTLAGPVTVRTQAPPQEGLEVPSLLLWFASLTPIWLLGAVLIIVLSWLVLGRRAGPAIELQVTVDDPDDDAAWDDARRRGPRLAAAYSHRLERLVGLLAVLTAVVGLAGIMGASTTAPPWSRIAEFHTLGDVGLIVTIALALAIVWFASGVRRSASLRRQAGILWDVSTFWPRVAHPFGPPCYAERVVPETTRRVRSALAEQPARPVILSGHSQGSTIAVAVATRLSDEHLRRLRLLTYGSQVRTWFGRVFPAVFGPDAMGTAPTSGPATFRSAAPDAPAETLPPSVGVPPWWPPLDDLPEYSLRFRLQAGATQTRWVNLFRRSDPLGFRVFSDFESTLAADVDTWQDRYVSEVANNGDLSTHSGYQLSEPYRDVIAGWVASVTTNDGRIP